MAEFAGFYQQRLEPMLVWANRGLSVAIVCLAIWIVALPLWPNIELSIEQLWDGTDGFVYQTQLASDQDSLQLKPIPQENRLVIPSIQVDGEVYEGGADVLNKGIWRRPKTSTPDRGGNTVLVAHRFLYTDGPETFYHLDKLKVGDKFSVYWQGKEYIYQVFETDVVSPRATQIEAESNEPIITLYTCTPLWTAKHRLVVKARQI